MSEVVPDLYRLAYVPGMFRCLECGFILSKRTLSVVSGNIGTTEENRQSEECPNDGTFMIHVTWEELANDNFKRATEGIAMKNELEKELDTLRKELAHALKVQVDYKLRAETAERERDQEEMEFAHSQLVKEGKKYCGLSLECVHERAYRNRAERESEMRRQEHLRTCKKVDELESKAEAIQAELQRVYEANSTNGELLRKSREQAEAMRGTLQQVQSEFESVARNTNAGMRYGSAVCVSQSTRDLVKKVIAESALRGDGEK